MSRDVVIAVPRPEPDPWLEPLPLPSALPPVPILDPALLPTEVRPWIEDVSERAQFPIDYPAAGIMVALGAVVGRQIGIWPKRRDNWLAVPNLWGAIIGRPGVLKSPALEEALRPLRRLEAQAREEFDRAMQDYKADTLVAEAAAKEGKKKIEAAIRRGDMTAAREHAMAAACEREAPIRRRYLTQDPTVEKLGELLSDTPRGLMVSRDELIGWLRGLDREGQQSARAFYLEAWNGTGGFIFDRIGRGTIEMESAVLSVLGGIPPGPLDNYLRAAIRGTAGDDGLLQRLQVMVWPDVSGTWVNVDRWPDSPARDAAFDVFARLDRLNPGELGADTDGPIPGLRFDPEGQELFDEWRASLEHRLRDPDTDEPDAFVSHLAKYRSLAPSLALLYHLANGHSGPVSAEAVAAALAWCDYLEAHARRVYAVARNPEAKAARELERRLRRGDLNHPFTARDVYVNHWHALDRKSVEGALDYLEALNRVRPEGQESGGRPRVVWHVHPAVLEGRA